MIAYLIVFVLGFCVRHWWKKIYKLIDEYIEYGEENEKRVKGVK